MSHASAMKATEEVVMCLVKVEAAYGTDPTPTPADNLVYARSVTWADTINEVRLNRRRGKYTAPGITIANAWREITIETPVAGPEDPSTNPIDEPPVGALLAACGLKVSASGGPPADTLTYTLDSRAAQASVTVYLLIAPNDGGQWELIKTTGAKGNVELVGGDGDELFWRFTLTGLYHEPESVSAPTEPTPVAQDDHAPPRGHSITIDSRTDAITSFTIALNNEVKIVRTVSGGQFGVAYIWRSHTQPTFTVDPEYVKNATYDRSGKMWSEDPIAASIEINTIMGAQYLWTMANAQFGAYSHQAKEGIEAVEQVIYPRDTTSGTGDDSLTLVVTFP